MDKPAANSALAVIRSVAELRARVASWRGAGETVGLVPTMGYLHDAHLVMVGRCQALCDRTVVSIFVNPIQFGAGEDFDTYPRDEASDLAKLADAGVEVAYMPDTAAMYAPDFTTSVRVGGLTDGLCGGRRPGHFEGVATVCSKLFLQCLPDRAFFGEKDYQQLQVIRRLVRDLDLPLAIEAVSTVREPSGLAISSRNAYLDDGQRARATALNRVLRDTAAGLEAGAAVAEALAAGRDTLAAAADRLDYLELVDAETLAPLDPQAPLDCPARLLGAVFMGKTRLIDNVAVAASTKPQ